MNVICYGGGVNSTAMVLKLFDDQTPIDIILFGDTKAERPDTYKFISIFNDYLIKSGLPEIIAVSLKSTTLYDDCIKRKALPSLAYGFKSCSLRFKHEPQDKYLNNNVDARAVWAKGEKVYKYIGFDADEWHRIKEYESNKYINIYPLVDAEMNRADCKALIRKHGLPLPGKSSCFFCPSMRKSEIIELKKIFPELANKAIELETNAELHTVKGLGRSFAWSELLKSDQLDMFPDYTVEMACECYDG
jgi:hypothetical protein